jgi:hypothetical protein
MRNHKIAAALGMLTIVVLVTSTSASRLGEGRPNATTQRAAADSTTPKTSWGHPDLQGLWTSTGMAGVPIERPKQFGNRATLTDQELTERRIRAEKAAKDEKADRQGQVGNEQGPTHWYEWHRRESRATSLIIDPPDGRLPPMTPEGQKMKVVLGTVSPGPYAGPEDFNTWDRCITRGMPAAFIPTAYNNAYRILQTPEAVVIFFELLHTYRVIPVDGRPHADSRIRLWEGDSRGRWEGDTLVVDVRNFSDKTKGALPINASTGEGSRNGSIFTGTGGATHLVERFTRMGADMIRYEATINDPTVYTRPWTMALDLQRDDTYRVFEYACHEGNRAVENSLKGSRAQERTATRKKR